MPSISVPVFVESRYKVNRKRVVAAASRVLTEQQMTRDVQVSVAVVGDRKMRQLNKQYRNLDKTTNVLSFSLSDGDAVILPPVESNTLQLGDVIISYPQIIIEAAEENMLVDDKIDELVKHGMLHLLGIHHE